MHMRVHQEAPVTVIEELEEHGGTTSRRRDRVDPGGKLDPIERKNQA